MFLTRVFASFLFAGGILVMQAHAVLSWPGCADVADTDFKMTNLVTRADKINEPMKMAFDLVAGPGEDAAGKVDVYFTERNGLVRKYDSKQGKVIDLGSFNLTIGSNSSDGLMGIALDPAFKTNHNLYLYYTYKDASETSWRVSRFTLDNTNSQLNMASEKPIIKIPIKIGSQHPGGAIQFDSYGDLWIGTGNDFQLPNDAAHAYPVWSSANTNDLRGKILRIHPNPDGSYSIPQGNLFPAGDKTKPEIYIMGSRNPYSISLDPVRRWLTWGDVGPDNFDADGNPMNPDKSGQADNTEEHNLATAPGNYGYPFFAGNNYQCKAGIDPAKPVIPASADWGGVTPGLMELPPAIPAIHSYARSCAITGPIYRYDGDLNSSVKFPPHFTRKWLVTDFNGDQNKITAFTLSDDGSRITAQEQVLKAFPLHAPVSMQMGPDGALYVVNYAGYRSATAQTGIIRIDYTGTCRPTAPKLEMPPSSTVLRSTSTGLGITVRQIAPIVISVTATGAFSVEVRDLLGRPVAARKGMGSATLTLDEIKKPGVYFLDMKTSEGERSIKIVR